MLLRVIGQEEHDNLDLDCSFNDVVILFNVKWYLKSELFVGRSWI